MIEQRTRNQLNITKQIFLNIYHVLFDGTLVPSTKAVTHKTKQVEVKKVSLSLKTELVDI